MTKVLQIEAIPEEENTNDDEIEQEKKKCRRRKKKFGSEDPEESTGGHRVVICDEQVNFYINNGYGIRFLFRLFSFCMII